MIIYFKMLYYRLLSSLKCIHHRLNRSLPGLLLSVIHNGSWWQPTARQISYDKPFAVTQYFWVTPELQFYRISSHLLSSALCLPLSKAASSALLPPTHAASFAVPGRAEVVLRRESRSRQAGPLKREEEGVKWGLWMFGSLSTEVVSPSLSCGGFFSGDRLKKLKKWSFKWPPTKTKMRKWPPNWWSISCFLKRSPLKNPPLQRPLHSDLWQQFYSDLLFCL